jgi:hypothetical protein
MRDWLYIWKKLGIQIFAKNGRPALRNGSPSLLSIGTKKVAGWKQL